MALTSTTQQLCIKSVSVPFLMLAVAVLAAPCAGGILTEVGGLKPFGLGVTEEAFHAGIAEEDCDAPALNLLHYKAKYVKKAKKGEALVSESKSEADSKAQSDSRASTLKLPFFSQKTAKVEEGVIRVSDSKSEAQSESSARKVKLPFFSQKTPKAEEGMVLLSKSKSETQTESRASKMKLPFFSQKTAKAEEGMVRVSDSKSEAPSVSGARKLTLPFFSQKTPKAEEGTVLLSVSKSQTQSESSARKLKLPFFSEKTRKVEAEVVPKELLAEALDDEKDAGVALFQTDVHYVAARRKPAQINSIAVSADGSVDAATSSGHAALPGGKMAMTFGADGSVY